MRLQLDDLILQLPVDVREVTQEAIQLCARGESIPAAVAREALLRMAASVHRVEQRRKSDFRTDHKRRKLIGARVAISDYWRYRRAAEAQDLSLYQWIYNALDAAAWGGEF